MKTLNDYINIVREFENIPVMEQTPAAGGARLTPGPATGMVPGLAASKVPAGFTPGTIADVKRTMAMSGTTNVDDLVLSIKTELSKLFRLDRNTFTALVNELKTNPAAVAKFNPQQVIAQQGAAGASTAGLPPVKPIQL